MIALVLALSGVVVIAIAALLLRRLGPGYRVARLLAVAPQVSLAEAAQTPSAERPTYVRISGRVSSDEEFPDENDRPLVYRRIRLQARIDRRWQTLSDDQEAVPFGIEQRGDYVAVDGSSLADGLIVIRRESIGRAGELPPDVAADVKAPGLETLAPETPVRLVVEQVSAVEHAVAAGVVERDEDGTPVLRPGLGRPLVLTTVDLPAAMRIVAGQRRGLVVAATVLLLLGLALLASALVALVAAA